MPVRTLTAALAIAAATTLVACASSLDGVGHGSGAVPPPASTAASPAPSTATSSAPSSGVSSSGVSSPSASAPESSVAPVSGAATPCPQSDPEQTVLCLQGVLSTYWSAQLNHVVSERIVLDATPAETPPACRAGIEGGTAITCQADLTLYISHTFLALIEHYFHGLDRAVALASVASHEIGHVLQYTLRQPQIEQKRPTDATSQYVEQQADCLSGVWAGAEAGQHDLDVDEFVTDAEKLIELVSSNPEIETHGSPPTRRAAIERGIAGGSPGVCDLVTFH
jgi:hypothetical protein